MAQFLFVFLLLTATLVRAAPDYSSLTVAFDLSTLSSSLLLTGGALIGVYILRKGAWMVLNAFSDFQTDRELDRADYEDHLRDQERYGK